MTTSTRDARSGPFDFAQYQQFGIGLGAGLVVALFVWLYDHRVQPKVADVASDAPAAVEPAAHGGKAAGKQSAAAETVGDPAKDYAFYDMLPKFE